MTINSCNDDRASPAHMRQVEEKLKIQDYDVPNSTNTYNNDTTVTNSRRVSVLLGILSISVKSTKYFWIIRN